MDQNRLIEPLFESGDMDTLMLDDVIRSKIIEAVERVHMMAPYYLLEQGHNFGCVKEEGEEPSCALHWEEKECGWVELPEDFMRLVVFEMSDWERPVYDVISPSDALYKKQRGRIKALRGTSQRPVCAMVKRSIGNVLEFYSCKTNDATISQAVYVPYPKIEHEGDATGIDISERCYTAVIYTAAALTLISCEETEKGTTLLEISKSYLEK